MPVKTTVTELSDSRVRLDAEVPSHEVESRLDRTATQLGRDMKIPGFRKGKVPGAMVLQRIGRDTVLEQAIRDSLPEWYEQAVVGSGVSTVGDPKLDLQQLPPQGQPLSFSIEIAVTPKAKLGKYKGLDVGSREAEVSDDAIDHELGHMREHMSRLETVEREAREGDFVVVDFLGKVGDESFEGGEARDYLLELGSGRLVDGFEQQLVGAGAGDSRTVEVEFPGDYRAEDLAGKAATFEVDVKDVKERELPELDDEFASEASEFDTLEELRTDIGEKLRAAQDKSIEDEFRQAAVDAVVDKAKIDLSDELVEARAQEMWEQTERALARQGMDATTYLQATGKSKEEIVAESRHDAAQALAREAVLEAVANAESIEVTDDELLDVLTEAAAAEKAEPAQLLERLREAGRDAPIRRDLRIRKAVDVLVEQAKPIPMEKAKARKAIWTPTDDEDKAKAPSELWTPGSGDPG